MKTRLFGVLAIVGLVGVLSLGDIAVADGPENAGSALCGISEPGGAHSQTAADSGSPSVIL